MRNIVHVNETSSKITTAANNYSDTEYIVLDTQCASRNAIKDALRSQPNGTNDARPNVKFSETFKRSPFCAEDVAHTKNQKWNELNSLLINNRIGTLFKTHKGGIYPVGIALYSDEEGSSGRFIWNQFEKLIKANQTGPSRSIDA